MWLLRRLFIRGNPVRLRLATVAGLIGGIARMNMHKNARLTPQGQLLLVQRVTEQGWTVGSAACAAGLSQRQAYRWLARYRDGGTAALIDRSSAPQRRPHQVPAARVAEIERSRRLRLSGPAIARQLAMPVSTVGGILRHLGLGQLSALEPKPPVVRYQRERPGEPIDIDTKKLGRIAAVAIGSPARRSGPPTAGGPGSQPRGVTPGGGRRLAAGAKLCTTLGAPLCLKG